MATCVPVKKIDFSIQDFVRSLIVAWKTIYGNLPQKKQLAIIYAQWSIETGQGKFCWNNNIGNVKYVPGKESSDNIQYMMLSNVWEILNGKKVFFQPPHQATWFRSFVTLDDGVSFHLNFLRNSRYKKAWAAVEAGSPLDFVHLLKVANYYTASEADYAKAVALYFNKFMKEDTFEKIIASMVIPESATIVDHVEKSTIETIIPPQPIIPSSPVKEYFCNYKSIIQFLSNLFIKK